MIEIIPNWHPIFVHFTVAFLTLLAIIQVALWLTKNSTLLQAYKWMMLMTIPVIAVTLAAGFQAYFSVEHDARSHLAMTDHRNWALTTAATFLSAVGLYFTNISICKRFSAALILVTALLMSITAYKGGELVYRYGLGVISMPTVSGAGHDHHEEMKSHHETLGKGNEHNHKTHESHH